MRSGDTFGEYSLLSGQQADLAGPGVSCEFVTDSFVHLLELSRRDFVQTVSGYSQEVLEEVAEAQTLSRLRVASMANTMEGIDDQDSRLNLARWLCLTYKVECATAPGTRYRLKTIVQKMKSGVVGGWSHTYDNAEEEEEDKDEEEEFKEGG